MVLENKIFVCCFQCKYMYMGANVPRDGTIKNLRGTINRIYVNQCSTFLSIKFTRIGSCGFRGEDLFMFPIKGLWQIKRSPLDMASMNPRGMVGRFNEGDYSTLLHTKYN